MLIVYFFKLRFQCAAQWSFYVLCVYRKSFFLTQLRCYSDRLFPLPLPCVYIYCYFIGRLRFLIFLSLDIIFNPVDVCGIEINKTSIKIVHMKNEWPAICSLASFCVVSNKQTNKKKLLGRRKDEERASLLRSSMTFIVLTSYSIVYQNILKFSACGVLFPFWLQRNVTIVRWFVRLFAYYKCTAVCNSD